MNITQALQALIGYGTLSASFFVPSRLARLAPTKSGLFQLCVAWCVLWKYYGLSFVWAFYHSVINLSLVCHDIGCLAAEDIFQSEHACFGVCSQVGVVCYVHIPFGLFPLLMTFTSYWMDWSALWILWTVLLLEVCLATIILLLLQWAFSTTNNIVSRANLSTAFHVFFSIESVVNPLTASFKTLSVVDLLFSLLKRKRKGSVLIQRIVCSCFYICPMIQRLQHWIIWLSDHGAVRARYTSIIQQDLTPPVNIVLPPWAYTI